MYPNLNAERARRSITLETLAAGLDITIPTMSQKLIGKSPITLIEAKTIKKIIGTSLPLEVLFDTEAINN